MNLRTTLMLFLSLMVFNLESYTQDSTLTALPSDYLSQIEKRLKALEQKLDKESTKALAQLQKREEKIRKKLSRIDSTKAKQVFASAQVQYNNIQQKLNNPGSFTEYIPYLDTLKTSLKFLEQHKDVMADVKDAGQKLQGTMSKVKALENSLASAQHVKQFIRERKQYLQQQLGNLPFAKELKKINKQAYYYSAQIHEYKEVIKDQKKLECKAIELLSKSKAFQSFMQKHSELASLFRLPNSSDPASTISLQGLQTRASVQQALQDRFGNSTQVTEMLQQNVQAAQAQLNSLKDKVAGLGNGSIGNSSSEIDMPNFKVNQQRSKSFLKCIELGGNIQSQKARYFFPVTSDIALFVGYKLNSKSVVGLGAAYKVGLGNGWNHIALSHQGVGIRSFIDYQLKGSVFISGGYEQNYRNKIRSVQQLQDYSAWQSSGLIGLSKKYKVSKKLKGSMQLLWDFLSYQQMPRSQPLLFRIGYSLK